MKRMRPFWLMPLISLMFFSGCATNIATAIRGLDNDPDVVTINREALVAYESGEDAKAEALLKSLVRRMPNDGEAWFRLGNLYARTNQAELAAHAYEKALLVASGDARIWQNLGVVRLRQAWAAMLQANALLPGREPLSVQVEEILRHLGELPYLDLRSQPRTATANPAAPLGFAGGAGPNPAAPISTQPGSGAGSRAGTGAGAGAGLAPPGSTDAPPPAPARPGVISPTGVGRITAPAPLN